MIISTNRKGELKGILLTEEIVDGLARTEDLDQEDILAAYTLLSSAELVEKIRDGVDCTEARKYTNSTTAGSRGYIDRMATSIGNGLVDVDTASCNAPGSAQSAARAELRRLRAKYASKTTTTN